MTFEEELRDSMKHWLKDREALCRLAEREPRPHVWEELMRCIDIADDAIMAIINQDPRLQPQKEEGP